MPVWHDRTKEAVADGKLAVLGVIQEQHAERCQLFTQWKGIQWPILQDAINSLGPRAVPIIVAIDERGIVRAVNPQPDEFNTFLAFDEGNDVSAVSTRTANRQQLYENTLHLAGSQTTDAAPLLELGDGLMLWGGEQDLDAAVNAYHRAATLNSEDGPTHFRLGVALRSRYESESRKPDDFQRAIAHWNRALEKDPNQYIWRRRLQQYGPRMTKPYAFYDWVTQATTDIQARGEEPLPLRVALTRAELAFPAKRVDFATNLAEEEPDPGKKIHQDRQGLIRIVKTVVPPTAKPGSTARVFLELEPDRRRHVHWTNDAGPTIVWIGTDTNASKQLMPEKSRWNLENKESATTDETRVVELEVLVSGDAENPLQLSGYALYYVCAGESGTCVYRRQDFAVPIVLKTETP